MQRGTLLGARPRGVPAPPGPPMWTAATIALAARRSESGSAAIHGDPRFQALVPEMEGDHRRFRRRFETTEATHVQRLRTSGARGTRTPDLLGAIQPSCRAFRRSKLPISRGFVMP